MNFELCSLNGTITPRSQATISAFNIEYAYGFGVYETLRVVRGMPYFLDQHIDRLLRSALAIGLTHTVTNGIVMDWVRSLVHELGSETYNIKILFIGSSSPENTQCWILPLSPLFPDKKLFSEGAATITVEYERQFPQAKTLNMLGSYLAYRTAHAQACYDASLVDRSGNIREGTRTNFFTITGTTIIKPPKDQILDGVMQRFVLAAAHHYGYEVKEQAIPLKDISSVSAAFLTSTSSKVMPIRKMNDHVFIIPESLKKLQKLVNQALDECGGVFPE